MLNKINLADIRAFVLIDKMGGFGKAAKVMQVSSSHVSRQLSNLERSLGVTLMNRTTRSQELTQAGSLFLKECEQALKHIEHAAQELVNNNSQMQGHIRVNSVGGYIGENIVAPLIAKFLLKYPNITIDLDFSSDYVDLLTDKFDLVFRMGTIPDCAFVATHLTKFSIATLASASYLEKYGIPYEPQDLEKEHRCIVGSVTNWDYYSKISGKEITVNVSPIEFAKNGRVMVQSALLGLGIIRVPAIYCTKEIEQGELISLFNDWSIAKTPFSLLYHQDKFRPKRIRALVDFIKENAWQNI